MTSPDSNPSGPASDNDATPRTATFAQVARAVFWSFFGVRKGKHMQEDAVTIRPLHVVLVGLAAALGLVLALVVLVTLITRNA